MSSAFSNNPIYDANKERGRLFLVMYRELGKRYGQEEAVSVMRSASYEFGRGIGNSLACFAPCDFKGLVEAYALAPDDGATYSPDIRQLDEDGFEVQMMTCPIKDAWTDAGLSDEEICDLLRCAAPQDEATWEAAGFDYEITMWAPGREGCCHSKITRKSSSTER